MDTNGSQITESAAANGKVARALLAFASWLPLPTIALSSGRRSLKRAKTCF
jgi:hypothetical protein